jgi:hypothetical protein
MKSDTYTRKVLAAAFVGLFGISVASAGDKEPGTISAGKLAKDAKNYYGQTVTVKATVQDILGTHSFTLDEDAILARHDVLVLLPEGSLPTGLKHDDHVLVTGTVRRYVTSELDKDYDWFKDGEIVKSTTKIDFDTRPVLVATSVRVAGDAHAKHGKMSDNDSPVEIQRTGIEVVTPAKLSRDGKKFYGQTVTVRGEVDDVIDSRTFTLDEDSILPGPDVLVLVPKGVASTLVHDQVVTIVGTVRPYVMAEIKKDYDWFEDGKIVKRMGDKVDMKTRPVLVATSVRTAAGLEILALNQ